MQLLENETTPAAVTPGTVIGFRFYSAGVVHLEVENHTLRTGNPNPADVHELIVGPVKAARVVNLDRDDNFTLKGSVPHMKKGYWVYIHATPHSVQKNVLQRDGEEAQDFANVYRFTLKFRTRYDKDWHEMLELWQYNNTVRTPFGKRVDVMKQMLTLEGLADIVESSKVGLLLRLYDLTRKVSAEYFLMNHLEATIPVDLATAYRAVMEKAAYRNVEHSTDGRIVVKISEKFTEQFGSFSMDRIRSSNYEGWRA